jgi:phage baseplate assembly protein V
MDLAKHLIRSGIVSNVYPVRCTVRVTFPDADNLVTDELPLMLHKGQFVMPAVGDSVVCLFLGNGISSGFCLGTFYTDADTPPTQKVDDIGTWFPDGSYIYYSASEGRMHIKAASEVIIHGDLKVTGTIYGAIAP